MYTRLYSKHNKIHNSIPFHSFMTYYQNRLAQALLPKVSKMGEVYGLTLVTQIRDNFWWALYDKKHLLVVMKDCFYVNMDAYCMHRNLNFERCKNNNFLIFQHMKIKFGEYESDIPSRQYYTNGIQSFEDKLIEGLYYHPLLLPHVISEFDEDLKVKFKMYPPPSYRP